MRALEFSARWCAPPTPAPRSSSTIVGRVTHSLPRLTRGVLEAEVEGRAGLTPYAMWVSRFGLWPLWVASLLVVSVSDFRRRLTA